MKKTYYTFISNNNLKFEMVEYGKNISKVKDCKYNTIFHVQTKDLKVLNENENIVKESEVKLKIKFIKDI